MIEVSLFDDNLRPFLEAVGWLVEHRFDDDWNAVSHGVRGTDAEVDAWDGYQYYQGRIADFSVAFDASGSSIVLFRVNLPAEFESRIRLLSNFCWHFHRRHTLSER